RLFRLYLSQRFVTAFGRRTLSEYGARKADSNENEPCFHRIHRFASRHLRFSWRLIVESIRRAFVLCGPASGSSKLIAYLMIQPRSFYKLAPSGSECEPKIASLEWNKSDVAPGAQRHAARNSYSGFATETRQNW